MSRLTRRQWLAAMAASPALAADRDILIQDPPLLRPRLRPGEAFLEDGASNILPSIRAWDVNLRGGAFVEATTESVGDGVAARYTFPAGGAGRIVHERTEVDKAALTEYEGLSFWVKGDGSADRGLLTFGDHAVEASAPFDVAGREWRKVFLPWARFDPPIHGALHHLGFSILRGQPDGERRYLVDRIRLYKTPATERIEPTPERVSPGNQPARDYLAGQDLIPQILRLLRNRQPAAVLFAGDSITAGAQLYYTVPPARDNATAERRWSAAHLFALRAGQAVARRRGYAKASFQFERWDNKAGAWAHVIGSSESLEPKYDPAPWPRVNDRLRTIVYGAGGRQSAFALEHANEMLGHEPNLVVYQFAGNDLFKERDMHRDFERNLAQFVKRSKAAGAEVALMTSPPMLDFTEPTPESPYFHRGAPWAELIRQFAADNACALIDARRAFLCRGLHHAGDLYSDWAHPNHLGHRLLARLVEELLAPSGLTIWDDLPPC